MDYRLAYRMDYHSAQIPYCTYTHDLYEQHMGLEPWNLAPVGRFIVETQDIKHVFVT